jgi:hypothetical protein
MSGTFSAHDFLVNVDAWVNQTTSPNSGGGTALGDVGSISFRNGDGAAQTRPSEIYLRLALAATGWVKQNLININIFNVKTYGAVGDGVADDTIAINAAVAAAVAAGGGVIYFPPVNPATQAYRVTKTLPSQASIDLSNVHNLVFLGDGYASKIEMIGSAGFGDWFVFDLHNGTSNVRFLNLHLSGEGETNPEPNQQNHLIQVRGKSGETGGCRDVFVIGCWWSDVDGDRVRPLGSSANGVIQTVENIQYLYNGGDFAYCRAIMSSQRYVRGLIIHYNWLAGSHDNQVDMEATGQPTDEAPNRWTVLGNHANGQNFGTAVFTLSGIGSPNPTERNICAYNTLNDSGGIQGDHTERASIHGNIMKIASTVPQNAIDLVGTGDDNMITSNAITITADIAGDNLISVQTTVNLSRRSYILDNIVDGGSTDGTQSTKAIHLTNPNGSLVAGNIAVYTRNAVNKGIGISFEPNSAVELDNLCCYGNMILNPSGQTMDSGINVHPGFATSCRNFIMNYNWTRLSLVGMRLDRANAETFLDWRGCGNNNCLQVTSGTVLPPTDNSGVGMEGNAGPSPQIMLSNAGPQGNVTARIGSFLMNQFGSAGGVLSYKESGTGKTGWLGLGGSEVILGAASATTATAARFLAPGGADLASASSTEIQFAMPQARSLRNLRVRCVAGVGAANVTYTLRKNGVDTGQTVTISNTATGGVTGGGSVSFAAGDLVSVKVTKDAAPGTPQTGVEVTIEVAD